MKFQNKLILFEYLLVHINNTIIISKSNVLIFLINKI